MKNRLVAILLAFFLGLIGIHQFYLGHTGKGLLYLILTITGVGAIVSFILAIIDFLSLCIMSDEKFNKKYNPKA